MKSKGKLLKGFRAAIALVLIAVAIGCVATRLPQVFSDRDTALAAAAFTLTDGRMFAESGTEPSTAASEAPPNTRPHTERKAAMAADTQPKQRDKSSYYDSFGNHDGEARYSVAEKTVQPYGVAVDGCYLTDTTSEDVDFLSLLQSPLTFRIQRNADAPQVLIYHTHTSEAYLDEDVDYFYESYESRTGNNDFNVVAVGDAIAAVLEKNGIKTLHDKTVHDSTYNGSYDRSAQTVQAYREKYPSVKVALDIHRDALGTEDCKVKTVFTHNGHKAAQIMILSGCDPDNDRGFENWQNNLSFALKLQHTAESLYPGMTRPLDFGYFAYNEYICDGSLLIEIGTDANTVDEAAYTGQLLADVLSRVL